MCGILAIYGKNADRRERDDEEIAAVLPAMLATLERRGPDEKALESMGPAWLCHTRLSIIDLHTGSQPIYNESGSVGTILNGEIYNYRALRDDLRGRGHVFRTESDTEVIVHLYEEHGERLFEHLHGMFALVVYDRDADVLLAGRDRLGQKPIIYRETDDHLFLASELKTLLAWPHAPRVIEPRALTLYLNCMYVPAPLCIFEGYRKLEPAHYLKLEKGKLSSHRYWQPDLQADWSMSRASAVEGFLELFEAAVRERLVSDVPLGVFLSGGIDSSAVTAFAQRASSDPVRTFAIGLADEMDERPFARTVAEHCGTAHTELSARGDVAEAFPLVMDYFDEPFADSSSVPTYLVAREARDQVTVVLTGDGGDELFAGYESYLQQKRQRGSLFASRWHRVRERLGLGSDGYARASGPWPIEHWRRGRSVVPTDELARWLGGRTADADGFYDSHRWLELRDDDALSVAFEHDLNYYLPDDLLKKVDMASMLTSLECRSPFLDHRLVEFCFRIPPSLKLRNDSAKFVLKSAMADHLPAGILNRPKHGFGAPVARWVGGPLRQLSGDLIRPGCRCEDWLDPAAVRGVAARMRSGEDDGDWRLPLQFWSLLVLEWWMKRYL